LTDTAFKQLLREGKSNIQVLFEYYKSKYNYPYEVFMQALPMWLVNMQPDVFMKWGGNIDKCTEVGVEKIINDLKSKHNIK
jgi:hypothetical protein